MKMELKDSNQVDIFGPNYEKKISKQYNDPKNGLLTYYEQGHPTGWHLRTMHSIFLSRFYIFYIST